MVTELFAVLGPIMVVTLGALVCIASEAFLETDAKHRILPWIASAALLLAGAVLIPAVLNGASQSIAGVLVMESGRAWLLLGVALATLCSIAALQHGLTRTKFVSGESYGMMLLASVGIMVMVQSAGYLPLYVGLEMASLAIYALIGMYRKRLEAGEGLFKYFVMGGVFSALLIYGVALTYGASGSIAFGHAPQEGRGMLFMLGQTFIVVGLLFKIGAVPFHTWSPDAYTGATIGVTGFMGAVMKVGAVLGLLAVWLNAVAIYGGFGVDLPLSIGTDLIISDQVRAGLGYLPTILLSLAVLSLLLGTFSALGQTSLRRLTAYSGIAHAGYLLLAFVLPQASMSDQSFSMWIVWYYLIAYAIGSAGVMLAATVLAADNEGDSLAQLTGSARRFPLAGVAFTILVASLAGLPPTAGFLGKFLILADLVAKGEFTLAFIAMLMASVAVVFYLRLIIVIWSSSRETPTSVSAVPMSRLVSLVLMIAVVATFALMFIPALIGGQA